MMNDREKRLLETLSSTAKAAIATVVPGLGVAISGWDAYNRAKLDQSVEALINNLQAKTDDLQKLMDSQWLKSPDGQQFSWKVVDSALDVQLIDKQEFFANAFVNGVQSHDMAQLEKLKFLDMLRHLSLTALVVLSEMDKLFAGQVRRPNRSTDPTGAYPLVDAEAIKRGTLPFIIGFSRSHAGAWERGETSMRKNRCSTILKNMTTCRRPTPYSPIAANSTPTSSPLGKHSNSFI